MTLTLHFHPLSSYCWKALIALYETATPFERNIVDLSNAEQRAAFLALWPIGKFPVIRDDATGEVIPESTIIIEYLAQRAGASGSALIPLDAERARETRLRDRFFDLYIHNPMQAIVGDKLRPADSRDPFGLARARAQLATSYTMVDSDMRNREWAIGDAFTMADCAAAPALFYANRLVPLAEHRHAAAYLERLLARPSVARVIGEAKPYFHMVPS